VLPDPLVARTRQGKPFSAVSDTAVDLGYRQLPVVDLANRGDQLPG
jgi:hypothetical protein